MTSEDILSSEASKEELGYQVTSFVGPFGVLSMQAAFDI